MEKPWWETLFPQCQKETIEMIQPKSSKQNGQGNVITETYVPHSLLTLQKPVVQSWVSTNSGLKFNPMFQFLCFYISVYFNTLQTKTTIDPDKISEEISRNTIKLLESLEKILR